MDDAQQEAEPEARIGQKVEFGLAARLKELAEFGAVQQHLVDDAVAQAEHGLCVLLESHRQSLNELGVEVEDNALGDAVKTIVHGLGQAGQERGQYIKDDFLRQFGQFRGEQPSDLPRIEPPQGLGDGEQLRRDHVGQGDGQGPRLAGNNALPSEQSEGHFGLPVQGHAPKGNGVKDHLHGEPIGEPPDEGRHTGNQQVRDGPRLEFGHGHGNAGGKARGHVSESESVVVSVVVAAIIVRGVGVSSPGCGQQKGIGVNALVERRSRKAAEHSRVRKRRPLVRRESGGRRRVGIIASHEQQKEKNCQWALLLLLWTKWRQHAAGP